MSRNEPKFPKLSPFLLFFSEGFIKINDDSRIKAIDLNMADFQPHLSDTTEIKKQHTTNMN